MKEVTGKKVVIKKKPAKKSLGRQSPRWRPKNHDVFLATNGLTTAPLGPDRVR